MGNRVGIGEMEQKGRILIPKHLREEIEIKPGQKVVIEMKDQGLFIKPIKDAREFSLELKGCIKESRIKPSEIKEIWKNSKK